jgi:hypothetical protein
MGPPSPHQHFFPDERLESMTNQVFNSLILEKLKRKAFERRTRPNFVATLCLSSNLAMTCYLLLHFQSYANFSKVHSVS